MYLQELPRALFDMTINTAALLAINGSSFDGERRISPESIPIGIDSAS